MCDYKSYIVTSFIISSSHKLNFSKYFFKNISLQFGLFACWLTVGTRNIKFITCSNEMQLNSISVLSDH